MPTYTPTGPATSLTPAAARMLAKLQDGVAFLTYSARAAASIRAAVELQGLGLVVLTGHHNGELRVAFPALTLDNHERASTVICATHPEWGVRRFERDPSGRGHHSFGEGSNSALLFESEFGRWLVASWLEVGEPRAPAEVAPGLPAQADPHAWRGLQRPRDGRGPGTGEGGQVEDSGQRHGARLPAAEHAHLDEGRPRPTSTAKPGSREVRVGDLGRFLERHDPQFLEGDLDQQTDAARVGALTDRADPHTAHRLGRDRDGDGVVGCRESPSAPPWTPCRPTSGRLGTTPRPRLDLSSHPCDYGCMLDQIYQTVWCQVFSSSWTAHGGPDHTQQRLAARQEADLAAAAAVQEWDPAMQTAAIAAKTKADNAAHPAPTADDFTIDGEFVEFYADGEEAPCERFQLRIDEVGDDGVYFSLYCDGTLHDGFTSLDEVARSFPQVAVDLDDWKAGRLAPFVVVRAAAFAHAAVEDPSDAEEDEDDDEDEDEEG